jgi:hypothetical protein
MNVSTFTQQQVDASAAKLGITQFGWSYQKGQVPLAAVERCVEWLSVKRTKGELLGHSTYGLKHRVEQWSSLIGDPMYIPQGAFIVAAVLSGHQIKRIPESPNGRFVK